MVLITPHPARLGVQGPRCRDPGLGGARAPLAREAHVCTRTFRPAALCKPGLGTGQRPALRARPELGLCTGGAQGAGCRAHSGFLLHNWQVERLLLEPQVRTGTRQPCAAAEALLLLSSPFDRPRHPHNCAPTAAMGEAPAAGQAGEGGTARAGAGGEEEGASHAPPHLDLANRHAPRILAPPLAFGLRAAQPVIIKLRGGGAPRQRRTPANRARSPCRVIGRATKQKSLLNSGREADGGGGEGSRASGFVGLTCPRSPAATGGGQRVRRRGRRQVRRGEELPGRRRSPRPSPSVRRGAARPEADRGRQVAAGPGVR